MVDRMSTARVLERLGGEQFVQRLVGQIEAIAQAVEETGQPGKVTLVVKVFKPKEAERGDLFVGFETQLAPTLPKPKSRKTALYITEDGLATSDTRQQQMDLRVVEQGTPEARTVEQGQPATRRVGE